MSQHFLLSSRAKTLSIKEVLRMSDEEAEETFRQIRWHDAGGEPYCPHCGAFDHMVLARRTRPDKRLAPCRYRCKSCRKDYTVTSSTLFASAKLPMQDYLLAILIFCNEVKGKSALALSRDLKIAYKSAWVLAHKLREGIAETMRAKTVGGPGKVVEFDGAYYGGYVKPSNLKEERRDRRLAKNQNGKRMVVVVVRERGPDGQSVTGVFKSEADSRAFVVGRIRHGTEEVHADEAPSWNAVGKHYGPKMRRINHDQDGYSVDDACTNAAESFHSRMRRAEMGHHHHVAGPYLQRYAHESSWREDNRRVDNAEQFTLITRFALTKKTSPDFVGYWQRHKA